MAQVASSEALSMVAAKLQGSTNGTTWVDLSGYASSIEEGEMTRKAGTVFTYSGDKCIIKSGKLSPIDLNVTVVYSEDSAGAMAILLGQFQAAGGGPYYLQWSPKGGATGTWQYTTDAGVITKLPLPGGKAEDGAPVVIKFTLMTPFVTKAAVTS